MVRPSYEEQLNALVAAVGNLKARKISPETGSAIRHQLNKIIVDTESQIATSQKLEGLYKHRLQFLKRLQRRVWDYTKPRGEDS